MSSTELHYGDCLEVMAQMSDASVDSIVTDPPYGLAFMNKTWDHAVPSKEYWIEALRVAKPGAMLLAFGGTRVFHRLMVAIEDAGWEIRDTLMWVYGCLCEDSEILTDDGWKKWDTVISGSMVACYNVDDKSISFMPNEDVVIYDYEDTAYHIQSDTTDQLVSKNHRCIVERDGREVFRYAEALQCNESVPILEALPELPETISMQDERTGKKEQILLKEMHISSNISIKKGQAESEKKAKGKNSMPSVWARFLATQVTLRESERANMQPSVQWEVEGRGLEGSRVKGSRCLDKRNSGTILGENERPKQSSLEGWGYIYQAKRALLELSNKVREVSKGFFPDGPKGRVCDGASLAGGSGNWESSKAVGGGSSHRSQPGKQQPKKLDAIQNEWGTQEVRMGRYQHTATMATVTPVQYKGKMWCVRVPTGAFVARRNGKVFVTGNSGFPKSANISKLIDKQLGAEREEVGLQRGAGSNECGYKSGSGGALASAFNATIPATPQAQQWDGYGTALKPSWEPIIMAMKPIDGTYANNAMAHGVAGINIDACRVLIEDGAKMARNNREGSNGWKNSSGGANSAALNGEPSGRWPANLVHDGSDEVMALFPSAVGGGSVRKDSPSDSTKNAYGHYERRSLVSHNDQGSAARFFYCAKASPADRDFGLNASRATTNTNDGRQADIDNAYQRGVTQRKNPHPTVKPTELMRWLVRLVSMPNGSTILDPFMGSGSTGVACLLEGQNFIGIERDEESYQVASERLAGTKSITDMEWQTVTDTPASYEDMPLFRS